MKASTTHRKRAGQVGAILVALAASAASPVQADPLTVGNVLTGQKSTITGVIRESTPDGTFVQTLDTTTPGGIETGMCFDATGNLYTTNFRAFSMSRFSPGGVLLDANFIDFSPATPSSCAFDAAGHLYVGLSDADAVTMPGGGGGGLLKYDISGPAVVQIGAFAPAPERRGTDAIDLAPDQCTLLYTSFGHAIKRFDVCAGVQLGDFCEPCDDGNGGTAGPFMALRILIGGGGVLVADTGGATQGAVRRYSGDVVSGTGTHTGAYVGENLLGPICGLDGDQPCFLPLAVNLDPDGQSFWTADRTTNEVFRFSIDTPGAPLQPPFCGAPACDFFHLGRVSGLAIVGELTAATMAATITASIGAGDKVYDGSTAAPITGCALTGVGPADDGLVLCVVSDAAFADPLVGNDKTVSATVGLIGPAASKYALASTTAQTTASILPRPVTVAADAKSKTYADADPALTYQITGGSLVDGEGFAGALTRDGGELVGAYPIRQGTLFLGDNYRLDYVGASLTIMPPVGRLSGTVYTDANADGFYDGGDAPLGGVTIALDGADVLGSAVALTATSAPDGTFAFSGLAAGAYTVTAPDTVGAAPVRTANPLIFPTFATAASLTGQDFGYAAAPAAASFLTYEQGSWGTRPENGNPGQLLADHFGQIYPTGVVIGGARTIRLTSASAVAAFLPQGGTPARLTQSYVDPTAKITVLAGQVLALTLNVDFSAAGITAQGLGSLTLAEGKLAGRTVRDVLALANGALGGSLPAGLTLTEINDVVNRINEAYVGGPPGSGYLR